MNIFRLLCLPSGEASEELRHNLFAQLPRDWQEGFVDAMGGGNLLYYRNVPDSRKWCAVYEKARAILKEDGVINSEDIKTILRDMEVEEMVLSVPVEYHAELNRMVCNANFNGRIVDQSMMAELIDDLDIDYDVKEDDFQESTMSIGIDMDADDLLNSSSKHIDVTRDAHFFARTRSSTYVFGYWNRSNHDEFRIEFKREPPTHVVDAR
jgi:hypothetical protein